MKSTVFFNIAIFLLMLVSYSLLANEKLLFATHTKPPLSNTIGSLYREVFQRMGYEIDFITLPGRRVVYLVNNGAIDGDASRMKSFKQISSDNTDNYLLVDEPIIDIELVVIVKKDTNLTTVSWKAINEGKVAYIRGSMNIQRNIDLKNRVPLPEVYAVMEMVKRGRVRSAILFKSVAIEMFEKEEIYNNVMKIIEKPIETFYLYPFLNKKHSELQPKLKKTLQEIKADGTYRKIIGQF